MHHNDISVGYQKRQTHHAITKVMEQTGCRSRSFSSVKSNMSSVKHQVNFRHWWLPRNNESEALLTIQPKLCLFFSNPDHPSPLSSLSLPPHPNPSLCSHLTSPNTIPLQCAFPACLFNSCLWPFTTPPHFFTTPPHLFAHSPCPIFPLLWWPHLLISHHPTQSCLSIQGGSKM